MNVIAALHETLMIIVAGVVGLVFEAFEISGKAEQDKPRKR